MEINSKAVIIVISLLAVIVSGNGHLASIFILGCFVSVVFAVARWINTEPSKQERLEALRKEILDYRPGKLTRRDVGDDFQFPQKAVLGVLGVQGSGKSAWLNSLLFAYTGEWKERYTEGDEAHHGGESCFRDPQKLNENIVLLDNRGMVNLASSLVFDVMEQIRGFRGLDPTARNPKGLQLHCPVFVFKYSHTTGTQVCREFVDELSKAIKRENGSYPIMLITFAEGITNQAEIIDEIVRYGMDRSSIYAVENYTRESHEEDIAKHIKLLEILKACLERADGNIAFRALAEREPRRCIVS